MTVNPRRAIDLNINASLEFLKIVMPTRISVMNRGDDEHLLEVNVIDELPDDHMPSKKWTAMRLKIRKEAQLRFVPKIVRQHRWKQQAPKDPTGRPLVGLEYIEPGDEILMHAAPTSEELKRHGLRRITELESHPETGMADTTAHDKHDISLEGGIEQRTMNRG